MDAKQAAAALDGNEYREEGSRELWAAMKAAGLVAVFGASDDLVEFRGAIDEEEGAPGHVLLTPAGLLKSECGEGDDCPYFKRLAKGAARISAKWGAEPRLSWSYETAIPHETFTILEDDEPYCRGIVFRLADVPAEEPR